MIPNNGIKSNNKTSFFIIILLLVRFSNLILVDNISTIFALFPVYRSAACWAGGFSSFRFWDGHAKFPAQLRDTIIQFSLGYFDAVFFDLVQ